MGTRYADAAPILLLALGLVAVPVGAGAQDPQPAAPAQPESTDAPAESTTAPAESTTVPPESAATPPESEPAQSGPTAGESPAPEPSEPAAQAEQPPASKDEAVHLEDIEVTADKRIKPQRDIPGSVGALRGEELEAMHAQSMKDYLKLIPGVTFIDQGNESSVPIIRGIASEIGLGFTGQATGVYLDDMPFADLSGPRSIPDMNPFDLERVEVLKGPQGTLFGSGALAGAVRYITQKPKPGVWEAKLSETVSDTRTGGGDAEVTAGALNVPLFGDAVALRAVGLLRKEPGLYDLSATDNSGNTLRDAPNADKLRQPAGRILASWDATDQLKVSGFYFAQKTHQDDVSLPANFEPFASPSDSDFSGGNLLATYDLGWANLLSSTNRMIKHTYSLFHQEFLLDQEHQNQNEFYNQLIGDVHGFTQEVRLSSPEGGDSRWTWLVGASLLKYHSFTFQYEPELGPPAPPPQRPEDVSPTERAQSFLFATVDSDAHERALFGEVTGRLGERWELTFGARKYTTQLIADTVVSGAQIVALTQKQEDHEHFEPESKGFNPKVALRYLHNQNVQVYWLASKGFQFGGVQLNPPVPAFVTASEQAGFHFAPYKSSDLWNYETGIRTEWLDRRLRFDVGLFYLDWRDLQLTIAVPVPPTNATFGLIANVGRAHSEGVETALEVLPFEGAKWTSSASWISAITDVAFDQANSAGPVQPGTRLPGTPRFAWSNVLSYAHALPYLSNWTAGPVLTHSHVGTSPDDIRPNGMIGGYDTLDARLTLTKSDSRFQPELSFGVNNLTDVKAKTYHNLAKSAVSGAPFDLEHYVQPRTVVMNLSLKY